MCLQDIAVIIDENGRSGLQMALSLGSRYRCSIAGIFLVDDLRLSVDSLSEIDHAPLSPFVTPGLPSLQRTGFRQLVPGRWNSYAILDALNTAEHLEQDFYRALERNGLDGSWHTVTSSDVADAVSLAMCHDIVVVAQDGHAEIASRLLRFGRPLLMVPCDGRATTLGDVVMIAWDGSRAAGRAVDAALPLLRRAEAVEVVSVDAPGHHWHGNEVVRHLRCHNIRARMVTISSGGHTPSDALMSHAETLKADLVVAGAYGHSRIRELIFGSTTRNFLRNRTVPMLLSH